MRRGAILAALLILAAQPLAAQGDSALAFAQRLATEGQGDSARALVRGWLRTTAPTDSTYPAILFTAGIVAGQLDSARMYLRRVSIEYANSPWADDALLRLAQLAFAAGDFAAASRTAQRVLLDYPLSDRRGHAAYWAARAELESGDTPSACEHLATAQSAAADDVELMNSVQYYRQRCRALAAPDSTAADSTGRQGDTVRAGATSYAVQVAAVGSVSQADALMRSLHEQGFESRVFQDADGLWKIRVGRFAQRAEAQRLAVELKQKLGGQPFVVEER